MFLKIRSLLALDVLKCLHSALFLSFLQYGIIVWEQTYGSHINPIFKLQEQAVRAISFQPRTHSRPILNDLTLLKLPGTFELRLLTFVSDSIKKTSPCCCHSFFLFSSSVHQYSIRHAIQGNICMLQKNSLQYGLKSTRFLCAKLWNVLPIKV